MTVQSADEVDLAALQIDPEETTLGKFELPPEDEKEESREKQLGLIDLGPDVPRPPRPTRRGRRVRGRAGEAKRPKGEARRRRAEPWP